MEVHQSRYAESRLLLAEWSGRRHREQQTVDNHCELTSVHLENKTIDHAIAASITGSYDIIQTLYDWKYKKGSLHCNGLNMSLQIQAKDLKAFLQTRNIPDQTLNKDVLCKMYSNKCVAWNVPKYHFFITVGFHKPFVYKWCAYNNSVQQMSSTIWKRDKKFFKMTKIPHGFTLHSSTADFNYNERDP